ncbi:MAG: PIN domain-containing protein [Chloroflexi bacterium]|nr:PIN domain-containing protein [Chloroflexota bacterium]
MKIYLDTSLYNRPFDEQTQPRIWLETMALTMIFQMIESEQVDLVTSSVVDFENNKNPFPERKEWVNGCLKLSKQKVVLDTSIRERALELGGQQRIKPIDALHLACGESGQADFFLTCDDRVVKRYRGKKMVVLNPVQFMLKATEEGKI